MISVKCENCGKSINAKDEYAGRTAKCPNCGSSITVPAASADAPSPGAQAPPTAQQQPAGTTVVVQMPQEQQAGGEIGPAIKRGIVVWLLSGVCAGLQYFYLGQTGKGILFTLITLLFWTPVIFFTCGIGLVGAIPYGIVLLVDSLVVAGRMRKQAISPWRFF